MTTATTVQVKLKLRGDTAANWTSVNPVLLANELGRETDTGKVKIGDGATAWTSLAYQPFGALITNADISATAEIAVSKLADGAARQLLQTDAAGTGVEWASNIDIPGTLDVTGAATFDSSVTVQGDLTVNGTTTTIDTTTLVVEDKNIEMGVVTTPTDVTADGGGITLKGSTDKTINWVDATDAWTFSEHVDLASAKEYRIAGTKVLDATSLGSAVVGSSLTSVGTIGTGVWEGTAINKTYLDSTLVSTGDTGTVTSTMIANGTIVNDDINASAAIAGTKISPDFGSQTITTTGVVSAPLGAAATPSITFTGDTNTGIYSPGADQVAISTNSTERVEFGTSEVVFNDGGENYDFRIEGDTNANLFFVDASADKVGIGTTSPQALLHCSTSSTTVTARFEESTKSALLIWHPSAAECGLLADGANQDLVFGTNSAERIRITSTGVVELPIGVSALIGQVATTSHAAGNVGSVGLFVSDGGGNSGVFVHNTHNGTYSSQDIRFLTAEGGVSSATERARIDSSGRLLVGTPASPAYKLQLDTDSAGKPSTNTWTIVSDERIKEEIELADLDLCYEAVKNIPLKRFKWKDQVYTEEQAYDRRKLGWIAQDVEAVFPKAVRQHEFKYNQVFEEIVVPAVPEELDDDGNVVTEAQPERIEKGELISEEVIEDCLDLNSDQLYAAMYGAIQKLISKVETLEAEIAALKA